MEERTFCKTIYAVLCCLLLSTSLFAQKQKVDTTHIYSIPEITVSDPYQTREVRSTTPEQIFSKEELKNLHALQVSDAIKHFAGVTVKDYGGIGGLKTVSIRSLGAQHTAVAYDGITISDCQTGQIDIGRFSLNNVDRLSLHNGQGDNIFQPARTFASAGLLNIQTPTPYFSAHKQTNIAAEFKTGSWGLVNPSLLLERHSLIHGACLPMENGCLQTVIIHLSCTTETAKTCKPAKRNVTTPMYKISVQK